MTGTQSSRGLAWLDHEFAAGLVLVVGVATALAWSAASSSYFSLLTTATRWTLARDLGVASIHDVVVNGLMTVFFYAVGLELTRELRRRGRAGLRDSWSPVAGAIGGMAVTALASVVVGVVVHSVALRRGWGVPMATDVAFALGVLAVAGRRLPRDVRTFLLTLAIADDVLSVVALSVDGTSRPRPFGVLALVVVLALGVWGARRWRRSDVNVLLLIALWCCFAAARVEPALAGVLAGALASVPAEQHLVLERRATRTSVALVLPLFALVACGVHWPHLRLGTAVTTVFVATILIRLLGKALGVTAGVAVAARWGARRPKGLTWPLVAAIGFVCAVGFTVPLLFAGHLFGAGSPLYAGYALGLLASTAIAAVLGGVWLRHLSLRD